MGRLCARVFDDTGEGILRSGRAIDCSYAVASGKRAFRRFRCNLSPVLADQRFGINLTMRVAEARGYRLHAALRAVRAWSAGKRTALHARRVRRFVDFG